MQNRELLTSTTVASWVYDIAISLSASHNTLESKKLDIVQSVGKRKKVWHSTATSSISSKDKARDFNTGIKRRREK